MPSPFSSCYNLQPKCTAELAVIGGHLVAVASSRATYTVWHAQQVSRAGTGASFRPLSSRFPTSWPAKEAGPCRLGCHPSLRWGHLRYVPYGRHPLTHLSHPYYQLPLVPQWSHQLNSFRECRGASRGGLDSAPVVAHQPTVPSTVCPHDTNNHRIPSLSRGSPK